MKYEQQTIAKKKMKIKYLQNLHADFKIMQNNFTQQTKFQIYV